MKLKELRKQKGLTQQQLGDLLGVKKAAVQKYESGKVKNLKHDTLIKLSKIFDVPVTTFLYDNLEEQIIIEVKVLEDVSMLYGRDTVKALDYFVELNDVNKQKALIFLEDLAALQYFQNK